MGFLEGLYLDYLSLTSDRSYRSTAAKTWTSPTAAKNARNPIPVDQPRKIFKPRRSVPWNAKTDCSWPV